VDEGTQPPFDVIVIGGGIAGISVADELAVDHRVLLIEMESTLGFHATGRSAAMYLETYGGPQVRALTMGSRSFLENPPPGFTPPLMSPRPLLQVARPGRDSAIESLHEQVRTHVGTARLLTAGEAIAVCPIIRPGAISKGLLEPGAMELDVHALHQGHVRRFRERGGDIERDQTVSRLEQTGSGWDVHTQAGGVRHGRIVVNAAGAWADEVAKAAGCAPVGLTPMRRTVFTVPGEDVPGARDLALLYDVDETFYVKPEGHQFLCSPADRTLCEPGDVSADGLEIARALDEIREVTTLSARSVRTSWAGLRTFAPDGEFVVGFDEAAEGFFWLAGQGGYGIQTAPATARLAAALIRGEAPPDDLLSLGLDPAALSPRRFARTSE
jgi:D-arginine dehydrogenase